MEGNRVGGARTRNCGNGGGGEGGDYGSSSVRIQISPFATAFIFIYYCILISMYEYDRMQLMLRKGVLSSRMHMVEEREKKVDFRCAYFSPSYSHYIASNLSSHIHPFSYSYIQLLLLKAVEGWRAVSSEGGDIESGEHDVLWMDGMEVLTIEVRMCCCIFWYEQNL